MNNASDKNNRLVWEGSDTLFNKLDYAAAEKFWSSHYRHRKHRLAVCLFYRAYCRWRRRLRRRSRLSCRIESAEPARMNRRTRQNRIAAAARRGRLA